MRPVRVVLVDDHRVVCRALRSFLSAFPDLHVAGEAASGEELLKRLAEWQPDVVIMDLMLPGGMDGIAAIRRLRERAPRVQVVALTASTDEARVTAAVRAGAIGLVRKDAEPELLLEAVRAAAVGRSLVDPAARADAVSELTGRELEVLRELGRGRTNHQIAEALCVSDETVKSHIASILGKLQVANRGQAVAWGLKRGLIALEEL